MALPPNEIEEREIAIVKALHPIQWRRVCQVVEKTKIQTSVVTHALRAMAKRGVVETRSLHPDRSRSEVHYRRMK
jgi:ribosomal protein S25